MAQRDEEAQLPNDDGAYLQISLCVKNTVYVLKTLILDILLYLPDSNAD